MSGRRISIGLAGIGLAVAALAIAAAAPTSEGAFRGQNGLIVFASRMDFTYDEIVGRGGTWELYTTDPVGKRFTRLTRNRVEDQEPRWSPDARRITFVRSCCGARVRVRHIYVMNANGSGAHNISGPYNDDSPSWSPDGKRIAFAHHPRGDIWIMGADGSNRRQVRTEEGNHIDWGGHTPVWSHDGREIDFTGADPDVWENPKGGVFAVNVETGAVRMLFSGEVLLKEWSPDGRRMLMGDRRGLEVARADGTRRRLVKRRGESVFNCTFSPDGRKLGCIEHFPHEEDVELTVMNVDTTGMKRLTTNYSDEEPWPDWGRARR